MSGESISSIARSLKLSRPTVRKAVKSQVEPLYQRQRQPAPKLGEFQAQLTDWLALDARLTKRQRRTAQRLFECLQVEGYQGSYGPVQRFVMNWKQQGGISQTIKLAHSRLAYSRQMFVAAYPRETQEMVLDAHVKAFAFLGGVPKRMVSAPAPALLYLLHPCSRMTT